LRKRGRDPASPQRPQCEIAALAALFAFLTTEPTGIARGEKRLAVVAGAIAKATMCPNQQGTQPFSMKCAGNLETFLQPQSIGHATLCADSRTTIGGASHREQHRFALIDMGF